jgi:hypothetical protein
MNINNIYMSISENLLNYEEDYDLYDRDTIMIRLKII